MFPSGALETAVCSFKMDYNILSQLPNGEAKKLYHGNCSNMNQIAQTYDHGSARSFEGPTVSRTGTFV